MNHADLYRSLVHARRELWRVLEDTPDEVLARPLLGGERFRCLKDLVFHIAVVEDGWVNVDIRGAASALDAVPELNDTSGGPEYENVPLATLLDYWRAVEARTLAYLPTVTDHERSRVIVPDDAPEQRTTRTTVDGLLWHVMLHEVRHTAQIAVLLRTQGVVPPALDLLWYLPRS